jgi:alpha,alpha-trehalose phosphorylase
MRTGVLERRVEWVSPAGTAVRVTSRRLVSFTQRAIAALEYRVEPLGKPARIVVQSELVANEPLPALSGDPRLPAGLTAPLEHEEDGSRSVRAYLMHRTRSSKLRVAVGMDHEVECTAKVRHAAESRRDLARVTFTTLLDPGQQFCLRKTGAGGRDRPCATRWKARWPRPPRPAGMAC